MQARFNNGIAAFVAVLLGAWHPGSAFAGTNPVSCVVGEQSMPCTFGITDPPAIQYTQGAIKFQARISQAKMPVPEGELLQVTVNLVDSKNAIKCSQNYGNIKVLNSILNVDFVPADCILDDMVASNPDLAFQLVIGGAPLKAIPLGTVPYALKSNFTVHAQEAHQADVAGQAHYAHRITADRSTFVTNQVGTGYFDFYTHPTCSQSNPTPGCGGGTVYSDGDYAGFSGDGYIQWTPVEGNPAALHVCSKDLADHIVPLDVLYLESETTNANGALNIVGQTTAKGRLTVKNTAAAVDLMCEGESSFALMVSANGGVTINEANLKLADNSVVPDLVCKGEAEFDKIIEAKQDLVVNGGYLVDGLTVNNSGTTVGGLTVAPRLGVVAEADLVCHGDAHFDGLVTAGAGLAVTTALASFGGGAEVTSGALTVDAGSSLACKGNATFGVSGDATVLKIYSAVEFYDNVTLTGLGSSAIADGAITGAKILDGTIHTSDIGPLQITTGLLADDSVTSAKIVNGTITGGVGGDVASATIAGGPGGNIASGTVTGGPTGNIGTGTITFDNLAPGAVTLGKIATGAITGGPTGNLGTGLTRVHKLASAHVSPCEVAQAVIWPRPRRRTR